jgi:hypothetical protein
MCDTSSSEDMLWPTTAIHARQATSILFVEISEENARKLEAVLARFGFTSLGLTAKDFLDPGTIIQPGFPPNRIDLVTSISGVSFAHAWEHRICVRIDGLTMIFLDKTTLLANKAAT